MASPVQRSFIAGVLSPTMYANADMLRYQQGLKTLRNAVVLRTGGVQSRPGTEYGGSTKSNGAARLVPAVFDTGESYVLEFGNLYMRVWEDNALVTVGSPAAWVTATAYVQGDIRENDGVNYYCTVSHTSGASTEPGTGASWQTRWHALTDDIFEIPTDYTTAQLFDLQFAYQYRVVTIVHPSHPPATLTKGATDTAWVLADIDFTAAVNIPENVAVSGTAGTGWGYTVAARFFEGGVFSRSQADSFVRTNLTNTSLTSLVFSDLTVSPRTITWDAVTGAVSYSIYLNRGDGSPVYRINTADASTTYVDNGTAWLTAVQASPEEAEGIFDAAGEYPSVVGAYQQRLILAGSNDEPDVVYASKVGLPYNFNTSSPIVDEDSLSWRQVGRRANRIRHFAEVAQRLVQFSSVGESIIVGDTDGILRPGEVNPRQFSENGAANIPPLVVNDSALYVQARGGIVRDIAPIEANGFTGSDLTLQAAHLVDGYTLVDWCYQQTPNSVVWAVRDDGTLLSLTYVRELGVLGWATHDTDGTVESIACVPEGSEDAVYVVVSRTIDGGTVRYVERFADRLASVPICVDSAQSFTATPSATAPYSVPAGLSSWTARTTPTAEYIFAIVGTSRAVIVNAVQGGQPASSTDLTTWSAGTGVLGDFAAIAGTFGNGVYVMIGTDDAGAGVNVYSSANGTSWSPRTLTMTDPLESLYHVAYSSTLGFVAMEGTGQFVYISADGTTWAESATSGLPVGSSGYAMAWGPTPARLVATDPVGQNIYYSTNGIAWSTATTPEAPGASVIWAGDRFVSYYSDGIATAGLLTSTDGITWTAVPFSGGAAGFAPAQQLMFAWNGEVLLMQADDTAFTTGDFATFAAVTDSRDNILQSLAWAGWRSSFFSVVTAASSSSAVDTATYSENGAIVNCDWLEGESVAIQSATGVVLASPYGSAGAATVTDGRCVLPEGAPAVTSGTLGLPIVTDIQTLDLDTTGGTFKPQKFLITNVGAWLEETLSFYAGPEAPSTSTGLTLPSGGDMQPLQVLDRNENPITTPQTGFRSLNFEGRWSDSGSVFIRNVDPTPLTILALVPYGTYPR